MAEEEVRPGSFKDKYGRWQEDRRKSPDRRAVRKELHHHDRRTMFRRRADREFLERDHKEMIADALDELASHHKNKD